MKNPPVRFRIQSALVLVAISLSAGASSEAALTITNGTMDAAGDPLTGWTNVAAGGFESKVADGDLFGAMVKNLAASNFTGTTVGSTDNDWTGVLAGYTISVGFDLFAHSPGNATDTLVELLIDGVAVSNLTVLESELMNTRSPFALPDYTVGAGDIGKVVEVSFNTSIGPADAADWHQTGIDNVSVTVNVPEPSTMAIVGLGGIALLLRRRR